MVTSTAQTPLLSPVDVEREVPTTSNISRLNNNNEQELLQFYDPTAVLGISREVAFGYLILLTGGNVEYEAPTLEEVQQLQGDSQSLTAEQANTSQASTLDEESASLAYASIIDGNVLHACFGLKATANGRASAVPTIGDKQSSSVFCCFPTSSAALQLVLPHVAKNKLKMIDLVETLREVQDLYHEGSGVGVGGAEGGDADKDPLYVRIIQAYSKGFAAIVRFHDSKKYIKKKDGNSNNTGNQSIIVCCSKLLDKMNPFSKAKSDPKLERLQNDALGEIENGFQGLKEEIWECLERTATETAFTGVSVEDSVVGGRGGER